MPDVIQKFGYSLLGMMKAATEKVTDANGPPPGTAAFYNRAWWTMPTPNTYAAQLNLAAIPAYGRYLKFFRGRPKGTLPNANSYGLLGLGMILFRGVIVRRLRPVGG